MGGTGPQSVESICGGDKISPWSVRRDDYGLTETPDFEVRTSLTHLSLVDIVIKNGDKEVKPKGRKYPDSF